MAQFLNLFNSILVLLIPFLCYGFESLVYYAFRCLVETFLLFLRLEDSDHRIRNSSRVCPHLEISSSQPNILAMKAGATGRTEIPKRFSQLLPSICHMPLHALSLFAIHSLLSYGLKASSMRNYLLNFSTIRLSHVVRYHIFKLLLGV